MAGKQGFGTKLYVSISSVFTEVGGVTSIDPVGQKATIVDMSDMDSPGQYKEKAAGFLDAGQAKFSYNFINSNTGHQFLIANFGTTQAFRIVFPGSATPNKVEFSGIIADNGASVPFDNKMSGSCTIEKTGLDVWS
jgi:predicted secreted protein